MVVKKGKREEVQSVNEVSRVKEISVSVGITVNLGNYESARFECGLVVECGSYAGDDVGVDMVHEQAVMKLGELISSQEYILSDVVRDLTGSKQPTASKKPNRKG